MHAEIMLKTNQVSDVDSVSREILKYGGGLLRSSWATCLNAYVNVPGFQNNATIVPLCKEKGSKSECKRQDSVVWHTWNGLNTTLF